MKKIYHLATCTTNQRILRDLGEAIANFTKQNIKEEAITKTQLEEMRERSGTYEALFSRRAIKYKEMGLKEKQLTELDYKQLILEEYTFLKRPVFVVDDEIFVGNSKKNLSALKDKLNFK